MAVVGEVVNNKPCTFYHVHMARVKRQSVIEKANRSPKSQKRGEKAMNNVKVRQAIASNMLKYWQVAKLMGVSEMTLTRRLREELPDQEQARICRLIEEQTKNGGGKSGATSDNR